MRTGTAGLSLVSIVTTLGVVVVPIHRAAVNSSKSTVMLGEGGMHNNSKSGFYNDTAEFWNWVRPRHYKAPAPLEECPPPDAPARIPASCNAARSGVVHTRPLRRTVVDSEGCPLLSPHLI